MSIPALPPKPGGASASNPWATSGEIPPGPPMSMSNPFVQGLMKLFPNVDPGILSMYAYKFLDNMRQALGNEIARMKKKSHEAAEAMKRAITGDE